MGIASSFIFSDLLTLKGVITNDQLQPLQADITLTDQKGDTVITTRSAADGTYSFTAPLVRNTAYALNFYNDSSFIYTKTIFSRDSAELKNLKTMLPKLKKGAKYSVGNINFVSGSVQYLPQALPSMYNLARLMRKNKMLRIKIIGHSNGRDMHDEKGIIEFTKGRATSIKNYLAIQGIDASRVETDGKGDHEMLFKKATATEKQQEQNRRVEIMVWLTDYPPRLFFAFLSTGMLSGSAMMPKVTALRLLT